MCFQSGSMRMAELGVVFLWVCALYMPCSRAVVSLLGWNSGRDMDVPIHVVSVSVYEENIAYRGSSE
jgi:hypothetical protein